MCIRDRDKYDIRENLWEIEAYCKSTSDGLKEYFPSLSTSLGTNCSKAVDGPLDLTFLSKFARIKGCEKLCFEPITPVNPPAEFYDCDDIFEEIGRAHV